ncbi:hypothetical protein ACWIGB_05355 [Streptomyces albidoflavus]
MPEPDHARLSFFHLPSPLTVRHLKQEYRQTFGPEHSWSPETQASYAAACARMATYLRGGCDA